jgi:hypothetical protein
MKRPALRSANIWEPIRRADAARRGLTVKKFAPLKASAFGLVIDRSVWFETSIAPRWTVAFRLVEQHGLPVIAEVRIFPDEPGHYPPGRWSGEYGAPTKVPPGGLSARALRQIRTQAFKADLRKIMARKVTVEMEKAEIEKANDGKRALKGTRREGTWGKEEWESVFPGVPLSPPSATRGRKGRSDRELARIAAIYERAYVANRPAIAAVAKAHRLSLTQARDAVRRARVRGLLSGGGKQGQGGGLLLPKAQEILKQDAKSKGGTRHAKR